MVSITLKITNDLKEMINRLSWVNWSEIVREEALIRLEEEKTLKKIRKIISKSEFSEKDADELAEKVKKAMRNGLKEKELI
jgi:Arc/MetJ-type ribon-helix-helix transcriptional regulator